MPRSIKACTGWSGGAWWLTEWGLSNNNRKAKYYRLTPQGRRQLRAESAKWTRHVDAVFKVLKPA